MALAVSLHAPNDELRNQLVPINRKHPIAELLDACWQYVESRTRARHLRIRDARRRQRPPGHARELAACCAGRPAKVNLIPFNPFPGTRYRRSPRAAIERSATLLKRGVIATMRRTRGDDIDAACGQLVGRVVDRTTVRLGARVRALNARASLRAARRGARAWCGCASNGRRGIALPRRRPPTCSSAPPTCSRATCRSPRTSSSAR